MDILIPIAVGVLLNTVIYLILWAVTKRREIATVGTLASFIVLLVASFVIGRWFGMGLAVVSGGMLLAYIVFLVIDVFGKSKVGSNKNYKTS